MIVDAAEKCRLLGKAFGQLRKAADGLNVACVCPNCLLKGKRKVKLAVRLDNGCFHCWVCGTKGGSVTSLIRRFHKEYIDDAKRLFPETERRHRDVVVTMATEHVALPTGYTFMASNLEPDTYNARRVVKYAYDRGISVADMWRYRLGYSTAPTLENRIIMPSFDAAGEVNFYTMRDVTGRLFPRYVNAQARKQSIVFNELDVDWSSELVLVEGPFDLFKCRMNATCMLGSTLDENFLLFDKIVENSTPVVLALDADAAASSQRIARLLYGYDVSVRIASVDGYKDVGEMTPDVVAARVASASEWTPENRLRRRIASLGG